MTGALGIAGVGLIGGSIALRARAAGIATIGFDRDARALAAARDAGALDDVAASIGELARRCEIVALALPIDAAIEALRDVAELAQPQLVFDVASVKVPIARAGAHLERFVPSHPLAGREIGGFGAADAALFADRTWVVDPSAAAGARARLHDLIALMGARVVEIAPGDHDRLVALTSHLPQALAVALGARVASAATADARAYAASGPGLASMLRLARSPAGLWAGIFRNNAGPVAAEMRSLAQTLLAAADALDQGEVETLMSYFADAGVAVAALERSDGPDRSSPYAVL